MTRHPLAWTTMDHIKMLLFFVVFFVVVTIVTYINLTALYQSNPAYGRNLFEEQIACERLNKAIVSSTYYWDEDMLMCRIKEDK